MVQPKIGTINWNWPSAECEGCVFLNDGCCDNMPTDDELLIDLDDVHCGLYKVAIDGQKRQEE